MEMVVMLVGFIAIGFWRGRRNCLWLLHDVALRRLWFGTSVWLIGSFTGVMLYMACKLEHILFQEYIGSSFVCRIAPRMLVACSRRQLIYLWASGGAN